ncbi:MAG: carbohydrate kinase [Mogibacterium sp.]|nr:carbohydrate kinase [Mogibacterium sp.]
MYIISYDIGTTGLKACLIEVKEGIKILRGEYEAYGLYVLDNGGVEQEPEEWWKAMCDSTKRLMEESAVKPEEIDGIALCSQMQGMVLVDKEGNALRRAMSYMDQRAVNEYDEIQRHGLQIADANVGMLLRSLALTTAAPTSVKDPLWKYKWVEKNEPEIFAEAHKWLDVKEYIIARLTGEFVMTYDSAYATFLMETKNNRNEWSEELCEMYGVNMKHLPKLIACSDVAGRLRAKQAEELGLCEGIKVYGSGGDATLIGVGAGSTAVGKTHIYWGTSGWVGTVIDEQKVDITAMIAGIVGAEPGKFNYFAEMETAGKCVEWAKNHLVLDEINIYIDQTKIPDSPESEYQSLYDYMSAVIAGIEPGSNGVLFAPWLHGNRCPFEDSNSSGMFFNLKLETGKAEMMRAVIEGVCFQLKWMLECEDKKVSTSDPIRFVGGGALSPINCQILADITGRVIETVEYNKDAGAVGAAILVAVGSGEISSFEEASKLIPAVAAYEPNPDNKAVYERNYNVFKQLYKSNRKLFALMNSLNQ